MNNPEFEGILNFRDLGGYPCAYGTTKEGVLFRSASICYGSKEDLALLKKLGIKSVIDLRGEDANKHQPSPFKDDPGICWKPLEIKVGERFPAKDEDLAPWYLSFVEDPATIRNLMRALLHMPKPILFHCETGKDRTGILALLVLLANGVSKEDACRDFNLSYDGRLEAYERALLAQWKDMPRFMFHMDPKVIAEFVELFFERYGTMEDYFEAIGLNEEEAGAISNILGKQVHCCGAVVFDDTGRVLVEHMAKGHYSMPKGHVEESDPSPEATALREIKEETGFDVAIVPGYKTESVYSHKEGKFKTITWFVSKVIGGHKQVQQEEVQDLYFLSPADAMRVLSYEADRKVLSDVCRFYFGK